jgi:3-oxoacyl-(acyl-carrier-protein) synthase
VTSTKGAIGLPLGAAPAVDVAIAALAQRFGVIPPTVNWKYPDPDCALNLSARPMVTSHARTFVHSHGLGGVNASMVLDRC